MPHLIIEHSANLADRVDIDALVHAVHRAVLATGLAPRAGLRTRAWATSHYEIADADPRNTYVAVTARLARGRSPEERQRVLDVLTDTVEAQLGDAAADTALSIEYQEIDPDSRINRNSLRHRIPDGPQP